MTNPYGEFIHFFAARLGDMNVKLIFPLPNLHMYQVSLPASRESLYSSTVSLNGSMVSFHVFRVKPSWPQGEPLQLSGESQLHHIESPRPQSEPPHLKG
jgi:hypothetical protein